MLMPDKLDILVILSVECLWLDGPGRYASPAHAARRNKALHCSDCECTFRLYVVTDDKLGSYARILSGTTVFDLFGFAV